MLGTGNTEVEKGGVLTGRESHKSALADACEECPGNTEEGGLS